MTAPLTPRELEDLPAKLPGWSVEQGRLTRTRTLDTFGEALDWVRMVGGIAEQLNHHPDIDIRWRTVTLRVCTHEADDQITDLDVDYARRVNQIDAP